MLFGKGMQKAKKNWEEFYNDVKSLVGPISRFAPDIIVPCLRGALIPATILSEELKTLEVFPVDIERVGDKRDVAFLYMPKLPLVGKKVLILEDDLYTGEGALRAKELFESQGAIVKIAAIYVTKEAVKYADFYFSSHEYENMPDYPWKPTRNSDRTRKKSMVSTKIASKN